MASTRLLLALIMAISTDANVYDEFPQWDPIPWVVKSTDHIELSCTHPKYFPFNNVVKYALRVQWILPKPTSYRHLNPGCSIEGWRALDKDQNYTLLIDKVSMNVPDAVDGMYVCAVLAKPDLSNNDSGIYAWHYLRWGVGLYANVPAMKDGTVGERYYWCFTYAWVSCLVAITMIVLFAVTVHFHNRVGLEMSTTDTHSDIESSSLSQGQKFAPSPTNRLEIDENVDY